jgi:hypothetical protein
VYAGHDVEHLLDTYSLEQLAAHARWVMQYQVRMLNMLLAPLAGMGGHKWKPHNLDKPKKRDPRHHRNADYDTDEAKEAAFNAALNRRFRVREVRVSDAESSGEGSDE